MSTENVQNNVAESTAPLRITISEVLSLLAQGKNRKEIAEHFGRTQTEMNKLVWSHPKLKGRKIKKQYTGIELEDDTEEETVAEVQEVVEEAVADLNTIAQEEVVVPEQNNAFANMTEAPVAPTSDWN